MYDTLESVVDAIMSKTTSIRNNWLRRTMLIVIAPPILLVSALVVLAEMVSAYVHEIVIAHWNVPGS